MELIKYQIVIFVCMFFINFTSIDFGGILIGIKNTISPDFVMQKKKYLYRTFSVRISICSYSIW